MSKEHGGEVVMRLRGEGVSTLFTVPKSMLPLLGWKPGDLVVVRVVEGCVVARKIPLDEVVSEMARATAREGVSDERS